MSQPGFFAKQSLRQSLCASTQGCSPREALAWNSPWVCVFGVGWQDISLMALACLASHQSKFALGGTPPALPAFEQVRSNPVQGAASESGRDGRSRPSTGGCSGGANDRAPDSALSYQLRVGSWRMDWGAGGKKTWVSAMKYISFPTPKQSHPLRSNYSKQLSL